MPICSMHKKYDSSISSNHRVVEKKLQISFGSGEIKGRLSQDDFNIFGIDINSLNFVEIREPDELIFEDAGYDGIIGLAFEG